ncbi:MAG: ABC transporter permease [Bdellovibrionaceae bacterium]|nr:ABC transporter permease [Pseudobdellovibrionaceae bacterium]
MIGIGVSAFAFLTVLFVMSGMNKSIESRIVALEPHLSLKKENNKSVSFLESHIIKDFFKEHKAKRISIYETQDVILRSMDGQFRGAIAQGFSRESLENFYYNLKELEKSKSNQRKEDINKKIENKDSVVSDQWMQMEAPAMNEIFIGVDLARALGVFEGDYVMVLQPESLLLAPGETPTFEKVQIKKIITTNLNDLDSQGVFYIRDLALNSLRTSLSRQVGIEVWLEDPFLAKSLKKAMVEKLETEPGWVVETWMDRNSALFYALKLEKLMIGIFLGLAGLISSFSIITVLALLISEKTRDIAMLRTLGLSQKKTIDIFIKMGMVISLVGLLIGAFAALFMGMYIERNPINILPDIYYDSSIPARVDYVLFVLVLVVSVVISFLGSYIPTRALERITPSQALRQKN